MSIYFENLGQKKELIESPSCVYFLLCVNYKAPPDIDR